MKAMTDDLEIGDDVLDQGMVYRVVDCEYDDRGRPIFGLKEIGPATRPVRSWLWALGAALVTVATLLSFCPLEVKP